MSTSTPTVVGSIVSLWRYPVKSMQGEELNAADITEYGVLGDRAYALLDSSDGRIVSAKNPRKWPDLFSFRAAFVEPPRLGEKTPAVRITLPDGTMRTSAESNVDETLSATLGRKVRLHTAAPAEGHLEEYWPDIDGLDHRDAVTVEAILPGAFFDGASIHLLTTATLDRLRRDYPQGHFDVRRFRPNIVVRPSSNDVDFLEDAWIGRTVALGAEVRLEVTKHCPRCVMTTLPQSHLPHDPGILRTAAAQNHALVGVYAQVVRPGRVRRNDPIELL